MRGSGPYFEASIRRPSPAAAGWRPSAWATSMISGPLAAGAAGAPLLTTETAPLACGGNTLTTGAEAAGAAGATVAMAENGIVATLVGRGVVTRQYSAPAPTTSAATTRRPPQRASGAKRTEAGGGFGARPRGSLSSSRKRSAPARAPRESRTGIVHAR